MDEYGFQRRISERIRAKRIARDILDVQKGASEGQLKRAWRRACKRHHPDRNDDDPGAAGRFNLVRLAYRCLADGEACEQLLQTVSDEDLEEVHMDNEEAGGNAWRYFLWWRENFF